MHEFRLAEDLLKIILDQAKLTEATKVKKAKVKVGEMLAVTAKALSFAITEISKGTLAEGMLLEVELVPMKIFCAECQKDLSEEMPISTCPHCGSLFIKSSGMDLGVELIEVEKGLPSG